MQVTALNPNEPFSYARKKGCLAVTLDVLPIGPQLQGDLADVILCVQFTDRIQ